MRGDAALRAAIVGCGRISEIHVETLKRLPGVELAAMCDLDRDRAGECAARHGVSGVFDDVEEMMRSCRPDVVHLLTPPRTHPALVDTVAAHGAHLYIEKPLAVGESEARTILAVAQRAGVRICPGHSRLFDTIFVAAERRIRRGDIGRVVSVRAEQGFTYEKAARSAQVPWSYTYDWGIFDSLMSHPLYLVSHFLREPDEPRVVAFDTGSVREAAVEELRVLIPSKGACGEVALSLTAAPERNRVEVVGTEGRITIDWGSLSVVVERNGFLPGNVQRLLGNFWVSAQHSGQVLRNGLGLATGRLKRYPGMRRLIEEFYCSLREGTPCPVTPEDGVLNARQLEAIRRVAELAAKPRPRAVCSGESAKPAEVLVTGGTGMVGARLVQRLSDQGRCVRATTRLVSRIRALDHVDWVRCELRDGEMLKNALQGVRTVYHCAALVAGPGSFKDFEESNVTATLRLVELAGEAGVENYVFLSSIGVYGCRSRRRCYLDEQAPYEPKAGDRGYYTQTKLAADRELLRWAGEHPSPRVTVLRPGTIYGPEASVPIGRFRMPSPKSRPVVIGSRRVAMPLTFVDNVIDAMLAAERSEGPTGRIYNLVDFPDLDQGEVARTLREVSAGRVRPVFLPYPAAWTMMLGLDLLGALRHGRLGAARYRLKRTMADMRYPSRAARQELGWEPRVSLGEGLRKTLACDDGTPFPH